MREMGKTMIRNIQKSGGSYYVTIPIEIVRNLHWKERQKVIIQKIPGKKIEIKDHR